MVCNQQTAYLQTKHVKYNNTCTTVLVRFPFIRPREIRKCICMSNCYKSKGVHYFATTQHSKLHA